MPSGGSIQLFRIFGIRVGANVSWFFVLFLFIFVLSGSFKDTLGGSTNEAYVTAVASALLFFGSLVLHELGHALVARRHGIGIAGIDLWLFGGIAKMERDTSSPGEEFKVAVAGPLVTAAIVGACVGLGALAYGWGDFWDAATLARGASVTPVALLLSWLATINAALFAFNLVPAFPLDGGRIARAAAWRLTGDRTRATRFAATLGQGFGYVLVGLGIVGIMAGAVGSGLWAIALGWFLGQAARGTARQTAFADRLGGVRVADIMDREPVAIPAQATVDRALEEYFLRYRWPWFPVVDAEGRFLGLAHQEPVEAAERAGELGRTVHELMESDGGDLHVAEGASIEALLASEPLRRFGALMAVDERGVLSGVVTLEQLRRALHRVAAPGVA